MLLNLRRALVYSVVAIAFTFAYAYAGTGLSQLAFKSQADGSITAHGSTLIGQNWYSPKTFHGQWFLGRPDDMGPYAANAKEDISGGDNPLEANGVSGESAATNLGPLSGVLVGNTEALVAIWKQLGVAHPTPDLVTTSASSYDPDISPQDALVEIPMVSKATGLSPGVLRQLVARQTHGAQLGFLGSSYIDVLQLNLALSKLKQQ
jgi:potassium-transporting ATPase KdpC subunit